MANQDILDTLTRILRELLEDDTIELNPETRREDVPDWDSFAYINFIIAIEMEYGIKFSVSEVESFDNVGAVLTRTEELLSSK